jgi:hypothetical protein
LANIVFVASIQTTRPIPPHDFLHGILSEHDEHMIPDDIREIRQYNRAIRGWSGS